MGRLRTALSTKKSRIMFGLGHWELLIILVESIQFGSTYPNIANQVRSIHK